MVNECLNGGVEGSGLGSGGYMDDLIADSRFWNFFRSWRRFNQGARLLMACAKALKA